jgi:hypothetical protein
MFSPKLEQFVELARQGNLIPVTCRILADFETPLSAYRKLRGQGESRAATLRAATRSSVAIPKLSSARPAAPWK